MAGSVGFCDRPFMPTYLLLPLLASLLLVCGLLFVKRVTSAGIKPWTVTLVANWFATLLFSLMWFLGGSVQPLADFWQPAAIAILYILGQVFTFAAVQHGDVSVATPVFGIKVLLVAVLATLFLGAALSWRIWVAASLATFGIGLVQWTPRSHATSVSHQSRMLLSIALAMAAASCFATFDILVQTYSPAWGTGRILPIAYAMVGLFSLAFLPAFQVRALQDPKLRLLLFAGGFLIATQAVCIVFTLATFGDAARVNVVYALRGMWGVALAWLAARIWGGSEASLPRSVMTARLIGACLLTAAVVLAIRI